MDSKEYLVRVQIGGAGDPEIWVPGSRIMLTDEQAIPHLQNGNIEPINETQAPATEPVSTQIVHTADEAAQSRAVKPAKVKKEETS